MKVADVDLLAHLLLNIVRDDDLLRVAISHGVVGIAGDQQDCVCHASDHAVGDDVGLRSDLATIIDSTGGRYVPIGTGGADEGIQRSHGSIFMDEGARVVEEKVGKGHADNLIFVVDVRGFAHGVSRQCAEALHAMLFGPDESQESELELAADHVVRAVCESGDHASIVDGARRVPAVASEVAEVNGPAVFPEQGMNCGIGADGNVALPGDADRLA